jgi:glutamyl-tRNA reductase
MSELTARHFVSAGVQIILVANRTYERAESIAAKLGGRAINYEAFPEELLSADIIICSTASPTPVVRPEMIAPAMKKRRGRPLFLIDIALPRDVDAAVGELDSVFLYDLDDLQEVVAGMSDERAKEASVAESIAREEAARFAAWYHGLEAVPVLTQLKDKHEQIRIAELRRLRNQIPDVPEDIWRRIDTATSAMINRITRDPVDVLKAAAAGTEDPPEVDLLLAAQRLFALSNGRRPEGENPVAGVDSEESTP